MLTIGDQTIVIAGSSDGVVFSPTWNDRHFTWTADETTGAPFPHITDETRDKQIATAQYRSDDEYLFDMYSAMGGFGKLKPANWLNADFLWAFNTNEFAVVMEEVGVMERSENRLWIDITGLNEYLNQMTEDELLMFLDRVTDPVNFQEAWKQDSRLFFTPDLENYVLQRPDGYVMEVSMEHPMDVFSQMRSARAVDVMYQMFEEPPTLDE